MLNMFALAEKIGFCFLISLLRLKSLLFLDLSPSKLSYFLSKNHFIFKYTIKLEKGDYHAKVQIRHDNDSFLEKFQNLVLALRTRLPTPINFECYADLESMLFYTFASLLNCSSSFREIDCFFLVTNCISHGFFAVVKVFIEGSSYSAPFFYP